MGICFWKKTEGLDRSAEGVRWSGWQMADGLRNPGRLRVFIFPFTKVSRYLILDLDPFRSRVCGLGQKGTFMGRNNTCYEHKWPLVRKGQK